MNRADGQKTTLVVRGETIEAALEQARSQLGVMDIKVLNASRMRRGGVAGFFAKDLGVELEVTPEDDARPLELALAHTTSATSSAQAQRAHNIAPLSEEPEYLRDVATEIAAATDGDRGVADLTRPTWAQVSAADEVVDQNAWERVLGSPAADNPVVDASALAVRDFTQEDETTSKVIRSTTTAAADGFAAVLNDQLTRTAAEFGGDENLDVSVFSSDPLTSSPSDESVSTAQYPTIEADETEMVPYDLANEDPEYLDVPDSNSLDLEVEHETIDSAFDSSLVHDLDEFVTSELTDSHQESVLPVPAARDERLSDSGVKASSDSTLVTYSLNDDPRPASSVADRVAEIIAPQQPAAPAAPAVQKLYIKPLQTPTTAATDPSVIKPAESSVIKSVPESAREEFERRVKAIAAEYMFEDLGDELNVQRVIDSALPLQPTFGTAQAQPASALPFAAVPTAISDDAVMPVSTQQAPRPPQAARPTVAPSASTSPSTTSPVITPPVITPPVSSSPASTPFSSLPSVPYGNDDEVQLPFEYEPTPVPQVIAPAPTTQPAASFVVPSAPEVTEVTPPALATVPPALAPAFDEQAEVAAQLAASQAISSAIAEQLFSGLKPAPQTSNPSTLDIPTNIQLFEGTTPSQPAVFSPVELAPLGGLDDLSDAVVSYVRPRPGQPGMTGIDQSLAVPSSGATGSPTGQDDDTEKPRFELDVQAWMASRNLRRVVSDTETAAKTTSAQSQPRERAEVREIPAWRVETWKASREARNVQPATQTRVAPSPQVISRLISMGVPHSVIAGLHDGLALRDALAAVKTYDPSAANVSLVVGRADLARKWAGGIARINGIPEHEVVVVSSTPVAGELSTVEHIQEWRMQHLNAHTVMAISLHAPSTNLRMVSRMVEAARADVVRLVVDANDVRAIEMWAQIAPNAVLDIVGMARAELPGALLALGMPIATVDGAPATPESLALTLLEHSSR